MALCVHGVSHMHWSSYANGDFWHLTALQNDSNVTDTAFGPKTTGSKSQTFLTQFLVLIAQAVHAHLSQQLAFGL